MADGATVNTFDPYAVRAQFPILSRQVNGKPLIYLDNAASAQKPRAVIDALVATMEGGYANVHRGLHTLSNEATEAFEKAREIVARFLNAESAEQVVWTKGGTEAINLVANGLGLSIQPGDEILVSEMEHHSNIVPWHLLRERRGAVIKWIPVKDDGSLDMAAYAALLGPRTRMVAVTHMSNVLGTINPVAEISRLAHAAGAQVLIDGCQGAVHATPDVQAIGCDFYVLTGHKLFAPTGIGALYGKAEALEALPPYQGGGEMIETVEQDRVTYARPPHRFEAGTPPILEAIGLGVALEWLAQYDRAAVQAHEYALYQHAVDRLQGETWLRTLGQAEGKGVSISEFVFVIFQGAFAAITCGLIVGAFAERAKFAAIPATRPPSRLTPTLAIPITRGSKIGCPNNSVSRSPWSMLGPGPGA